jgi:hypothetical protein
LFSAAVLAALHVVAIVICILKGKYELALLGAFIPFLGFVCAVRMARPSSLWARRFYRGERAARAVARAHAFDRRYGRLTGYLGDFIAGRPTDELAARRQAPATGTP